MNTPKTQAGESVGVEARPSGTRRSFLYGAGGVVALAALGSSAKLMAGSEELIRPPGGFDEDNFFSRCIRCDRCRSACPENAIGVAKLEDGLLALRTPKMEFRQGYCTTCEGEYPCIEVCPTQALKPFDIERDKMCMAVIDQEKCQLYGLSAACGAVCINYCPTDALYVDEGGRLQIREEDCWGCGACEYVCPANAYRSYDGRTDRGINMRPWQLVIS